MVLKQVKAANSLPTTLVTSFYLASLALMIAGETALQIESKQTQSRDQAASTPSEADIREMVKSLIESGPSNLPHIDRLEKSRLLDILDGQWLIWLSDDPYETGSRVSIEVERNGLIHYRSANEEKSETVTEAYLVIDGILIAFPKDGGFPDFLFTSEGKAFMLNMWVEQGFSELLPAVTSENLDSVNNNQILDYYWHPESLRTLGERAITELNRVLRSPFSENRRAHFQAFTAIDLLRPEPSTVLPAMLESLNGGCNPSALTIARVGGPTAVAPLLKALKNPNADVRADAAWALATLRPNQDGNFRVDLNGDVRIWENFPSFADSMSPALLQTLKDEDAIVRHRSAHALGEIGGNLDLVVPALVEALGDPHPLVRQHSAVALGKLATGDDPTTTALRDLLNDPEPYVRSSASATLNRFERGSPK